MATKNRLKVCPQSLTFVSILKSGTVQCSALTVWCTSFKMGSVVCKLHTAILHLPEVMPFFFNRQISFFFYYFNGELQKDSLNAKQYTAFSHTSQYERTLCTHCSLSRCKGGRVTALLPTHSSAQSYAELSCRSYIFMFR